MYNDKNVTRTTRRNTDMSSQLFHVMFYPVLIDYTNQRTIINNRKGNHMEKQTLVELLSVCTVRQDVELTCRGCKYKDKCLEGREEIVIKLVHELEKYKLKPAEYEKILKRIKRGDCDEEIQED